MAPTEMPVARRRSGVGGRICVMAAARYRRRRRNRRSRSARQKARAAGAWARRTAPRPGAHQDGSRPAGDLLLRLCAQRQTRPPPSPRSSTGHYGLRVTAAQRHLDRPPRPKRLTSRCENRPSRVAFDRASPTRSNPDLLPIRSEPRRVRRQQMRRPTSSPSCAESN